MKGKTVDYFPDLLGTGASPSASQQPRGTACARISTTFGVPCPVSPHLLRVQLEVVCVARKHGWMAPEHAHLETQHANLRASGGV